MKRRILTILSAVFLVFEVFAADKLEAGTADAPNYYVLMVGRGIPYLAYSEEYLSTPGGADTRLHRTSALTEANIWAVTPGEAEGTIKVVAYGTSRGLMTFLAANGYGNSYATGAIATAAKAQDIYPKYQDNGTVSLSVNNFEGYESDGNGGWFYYTLDATNNSEFLGNWIPGDTGTNWTAFKLDLTNGVDAALADVQAAALQAERDAKVAIYEGAFTNYANGVPWVADILGEGIAALKEVKPTPSYSTEIDSIWALYTGNAANALNTMFVGKDIALKNLRRANAGLTPYVSAGTGAYPMVASYATTPAAVFTMEAAEVGYYIYNAATQTYFNVTAEGAITTVAEKENATEVKFVLQAGDGFYGVDVLVPSKTEGYSAFNADQRAETNLVFWAGTAGGSIWAIELVKDWENMFIGNGTENNPYLVSDIIKKNSSDQESAWVKGYIVGSMIYNDVEKRNEFSATEFGNTNIVLSETKTIKGDNYIAVQLPSGQIRDALNLKDHPDFIGKKVMIYGDLSKYCGINGVRNTSQCQIQGPIEISVGKVRYAIENTQPGNEAAAISVANGNFSLDGLEIADFITFNGVDYPVTSIAGNAFKDISGFKGELKIGKNVKKIGAGAFSGCTGFTSLKLQEGLISIGNNAFYGCGGFTGSLNLPQSLTSIGGSAFYGCSGFTGALNLPESLTSIGSSVFQDCRFTGSLNLPQSLTSIGNSAFQGCSGFTGSLNLPESLTSIGSSAFRGCSGFTGSLNLPESLTSIGNGAFYNCSGLTGSLNIPETLTSIENSSFYGCRGLNGSLNIPSSISFIGDRAFGSTNFEKVICHRGTAPECNTSAFDYARKNILQVPENSITAYAMKAPWSGFANIVSIEPLSGIEFAEANVVCPLGGSVKLKVNKTPFGAEGEISFVSGNTAVATVDANGVVTGVAKGATAIIAMCGTLTASCVVTVEDPTIPATSLEYEGIIANVGETVAISAKVLPADATDPTISWSSSNPEVAAVDSEGTVWFNAAGSATITAECQGLDFSVPFVVKEVMARALNVFPVEAVGSIGHEFSLLALHEPENTTDKSVTWESSDPEVATVDADGRVSLAALGSAKITARSGEHTAECAVTVDNNIVSLTEMASTGVVIDIVEDGIVVRNASAGESIAVYAVDGKAVNGAVVESEEVHLKLATGIYIVKVSPATVAKVLIK